MLQSELTTSSRLDGYGIWEKYKEMILDAAETVLGYFGFDRSVYGNKKNIGPRKWRWLQEIRQERENDIRTEVI
jgi:hypothetical protein